MKRRVFFSLLLGGACLYLAVRKAEWAEVREAFSGFDPVFVLFILPMMVATHFFRAVRWSIMLRPIRPVGLKELFGMNAVGFLAIHVFPLRLGEVVRPLLLNRRQGVPFTSGVATIALERVFDGVVVVMFLLAGLATLSARARAVPIIGDLRLGHLGLTAAAVFVPLLAFLFLAVLRRDLAMAGVRVLTKLFPQRIAPRVLHVSENFLGGLAALPDLRSFVGMFLSSLGVWGSMVVAYTSCMHAFHLDLPFSAAFTLLGVASLGVGIPAAPGFVGTFQLAVVAALALYGVSNATALAYSVVMHVILLAYVVGVGMAFLPMQATGMGGLYREATAPGPDAK